MTSSVLDAALALADDAAAIPRENGELAFDAPWQGRALAMAVLLVERRGVEWDDFRQRLVAKIDHNPDRPYWDNWVAALDEFTGSFLSA